MAGADSQLRSLLRESSVKLRMSDKSLFAFLLRSPWWFSIVLMLIVALIARALLPEPFATAGTLGGFPFLVIGIMAAWRQRNAPDPARMAQILELLAAMSWRDFSACLEQSFVEQGYTVTPLHGGVVDLQLERNAQVTLVSAKRWKAAMAGVEIVREMLAAKVSVKATSCLCVSLHPATDQARQLAEKNAIQMISGLDLAALMSPALKPPR